MTPLSTKAQSLLAVARGDTPADAERAAIWEKVLATTQMVGTTASTAGKATDGTATASPLPAASATAGGSAAKLVLIGVAVGALATALGGAVAVNAIQNAPPAEPVRPIARVPARPDGRAHRAGLASAPVRGRAPSAVTATRGIADRTRAATGVHAPDAESALAEEARVLTEARRALVRGDTVVALALIDHAKRLPARALEPEQMGLEARALRAAGRADDAAAVELQLRGRFPDHALAR